MKFTLTTSLLVASANAFSTTNTNINNVIHTPMTLNAMMPDSNISDQVSERRTFLRNVAGVAFGASMGMLANEKPASASYSAYTNREKDWQERKGNGGKGSYTQFFRVVVVIGVILFLRN